MRDTIRNWLKRFLELFDSPKTFWVVFGWFLFSSIWIALSGAYSMAFDEYVHYGVIKLYEQQWSPFFNTQQVSADAFGAITRDASYLYHYVMSFPLRVFDIFDPSQTAQILFLRFFSIAFFAGGLLFFRAALQHGGFTTRMINLVLGFFILLPVVPLAAAQVNYDTLLFLLTGISLWLAVRASVTIRSEGQVPLGLLSWLVITVATTSLVKYAYLPIAVALAVYFITILIRKFGWKPKTWPRHIKVALGATKRWRVILTVLLLLLSLGLFAERYGINTVRYHTPTPECDQVMELRRCLAYEPFERNYSYHVGNYPLPMNEIVAYPFSEWTRGMIFSMLDVVSSKTTKGYFAGEPFLLTHILGFVVFAGGFIAALISARWLWCRNHTNQLFIIVSAIYVALLFAQNFMDFLHTHVAVAIQGRYLLPIMPLFLMLVVQAYGRLLRRTRPSIKIFLLAVACFMLLQGGSLLPFIIRQHDDWIWNNETVRNVNHAARTVLKPIVISKKVLIFD